MHGLRHSHNAFHAARKALIERTQDISEALGQPGGTLDIAYLVERASNSNQCSDHNAPGCQLPTSETADTTLPIALGVIIPLGAALIVFLYLHRRHVKKVKIEDANDKHASLDFGLGEHHVIGRKTPNRPQMSNIPDPEGLLTRGRGMSMDLDNPYIMAEDDARPSFHSMNRPPHDANDPYHSALVMNDNGPYPRSDSRLETASVASQSSRSNSTVAKSNLIRNAQRQPSSTPPMGYADISTSSPDFLPLPEPAQVLQRKPVAPAKDGISVHPLPQLPETATEAPPPPPKDTDAKETSRSRNSYTKSQNFSIPRNIDRTSLHSTVNEPSSGNQESPLPPMPTQTTPPPQLPTFAQEDFSFLASIENIEGANSSYPDTLGIVHKPSDVTNDIAHKPSGVTNEPVHPVAEQVHEQAKPVSNNLAVNTAQDPRRLSGIRPLPPDEVLDNPEQRANRIRSFYREYFDDSKPDPVGRYEYEQEYDYGQGYGYDNGYGNEYGYGYDYGQYEEDYYEDYNQEYYGDGAAYDHMTGDYGYAPAPYAEPIARRAMTPPPRAPPRYDGDNMSDYGYGQFIPGPRGQRAYSSSSGRNPMRGRGKASRKHMPPPAALTTLPTPHRLKEDSAIFNPLDFAPPPTYKDRARGSRPASPLGESRPYAPSVRAHNPLYSSYDELPAVPSPHALRKSGTFTALDFARPPRIARGDNASDAGSVRSAGSSMSAAHRYNIRNGAYSVSRMKKDYVGTKDDFAQSLRPTWDQRQ